jgi:hypothetical protein
MAIATFASPAGGSSAVPEKRVANFHDDSSDEELEGEMANGLSNSPVRSNGKAIGSALKKGDKGTKRRKAENDDTDSARTARKAEAEKLYEVRRELPFYQGEQSSDKLSTTKVTLHRKTNDHGGDYEARDDYSELQHSPRYITADLDDRSSARLVVESRHNYPNYCGRIQHR